MSKPKTLNEYYGQTASDYNEMHLAPNDAHFIALEASWPLLKLLDIHSILDVGCGTGRALLWYQNRLHDVKLSGIDSSPDLLQKAIQAVPNAELLEGNGEQLPFPDAHFDLVVATGIMHHVDCPEQCIREMFRTARKAVLISDHNNFAFGSPFLRRIRLALFAFSLLKAFTFIKQGFKNKGYSEGDGWWYSYSLLNNFTLISQLSKQVLILPTSRTNSDVLTNFLLCQSHLAILATKISLASNT